MEKYDVMKDIHSRAYNGYQCISREGAWYDEYNLEWHHESYTFIPFVDNLKKTLKPCPKCGCDKIFLNCHLPRWIAEEDQLIKDEVKDVVNGKTITTTTYRSNPVWINPMVEVYWFCSKCNYTPASSSYPHDCTDLEYFRKCIVEMADVWDHYAEKEIIDE